MLSALDGFEGTLCFNITGHTLEYLLKHSPETIDVLHSLLASKTIELLGTGYSHPIIPLINPLRMKQQILDQKKFMQNTFSTNLKGFWPPELAISPLILQQIKEIGYDWVTIDQEHLAQSQTLTNSANPFEKRSMSSTEILVKAYFSSNPLAKMGNYVKALRYLVRQNNLLKNSLETIQFSNTETLNAVLSSQSWWNSTRFAISKTTSLYKESKHLKLIQNSPNMFIPLYTSYIEFFGYREFGGKIPKPD